MMLVFLAYGVAVITEALQLTILKSGYFFYGQVDFND